MISNRTKTHLWHGCAIAAVSFAYLLYDLIFSGLVFDLHVGTHNFAAVNDEGASHTDWLVFFFCRALIFIAVIHWVRSNLTFRPKDLPGRILAGALYIVSIKELVIDLLLFYNEASLIVYDAVFYFFLAVYYVPRKTGDWILKGIKSDTLSGQNDAVWIAWTLPMRDIGILSVLPGKGVQGFNTLFRIGGKYYRAGFKKNEFGERVYRVCGPYSRPTISVLAERSVLERVDIKNVKSFLDEHRGIKDKFDAYSLTCIDAARETYEKRGYRFYSRLPSLHLLIKSQKNV